MSLKGFAEEKGLEYVTATSCCIQAVKYATHYSDGKSCLGNDLLRIKCWKSQVIPLKRFAEEKRLEYVTAKFCCIQSPKYATLCTDVSQNHASGRNC